MSETVKQYIYVISAGVAFYVMLTPTFLFMRKADDIRHNNKDTWTEYTTAMKGLQEGIKEFRSQQ